MMLYQNFNYIILVDLLSSLQNTYAFLIAVCYNEGPDTAQFRLQWSCTIQDNSLHVSNWYIGMQ